MAREHLTAFALVAAGAVLGACMRIGLGVVWADADYPWSIVAINVVGSAALGWFAGAHGTASRWWPLVGPGLLGSFTTFSALAVTPFITHMPALVSVLLLAATVVGCAVAAALGRTWATRRTTT